MSDYSRRRFLGMTAAAAGGALLIGVPMANTAIAGPSIPPLLRSSFTPLVGQGFELAHPGGRTTLTLAAVEDLTAGGEPERCFSLAFDGPSGPPLGEGVYDLTCGTLRHSLLVVPVDRGVVHPRYQVVVNNPTATS